MRAVVIIATHRRPAGVRRVLRALRTQVAAAQVEVLVVENGPREGVEAIVAEELGELGRYLYRPEGDKSAALNHALGATGRDFVIFLDDDVGVPPGLVDAYLRAARRRGPGVFFGGGLTPEAESLCPPHLLPYLPRSVRGWWYAERDTEIPPDQFEFFFGANWAAFRSDLQAAGAFTVGLGVTAARYSPVGEETELQQRLIARGCRPVYVAEATVTHPTPAEHHTAAWLARRRFRLGVAEWRQSWSERPQRRILGLPLWLLRRLARRQAEALHAAVRGAPLALRVENRMERAHLLGMMWGAMQDRTTHAAGRARASDRSAPGHTESGSLRNIAP